MAGGCIFGQHDCAAGKFGTCTESLADAQQGEQDRRPDSDGGVCGQKADSRGCDTHEGDGEDKDFLPADAITEPSQHECAHGAGQEADRVGDERGEQCDDLGLFREEDIAEDQACCHSIQCEVDVFHRRAQPD